MHFDAGPATTRCAVRITDADAYLVPRVARGGELIEGRRVRAPIRTASSRTIRAR